MASLNGITLKSLKVTEGHEGPFCQGDIYLDGKKIGFWSQDGNGGPDWFNFPAKEDAKRFYETVNAYYLSRPDKVDEIALIRGADLSGDLPTIGKEQDKTGQLRFPYDPECFMGELNELIFTEKDYKKAAKKDPMNSTMICIGYHYSRGVKPNGMYLFVSAKRRDLVEKIGHDYIYQKPNKELGYIKGIFTSLDDFENAQWVC